MSTTPPEAPSFITPADLAPFTTIAEAKAEAMIEDATAQALEIAPCIADPTFAKQSSVRAILRGAILRWNDAGSGALTQYSQAAPLGFSVSQSVDTRARVGGSNLFWPSEIKALQKLCNADAVLTGAFSVDTAPIPYDGHSLLCALRFGALYCSCMADISGGLGPLYEPNAP